MKTIGFAWSCAVCKTARYKMVDRLAAEQSLVTHSRDKHDGQVPNNAYVFPHDKAGKVVW